MIEAYTDFLRWNKKRLLVFSIIFCAGFFLFLFHVGHKENTLLAICLTVVMYILLWLVFFYPVVNSFVVIGRLTKDQSELSILSLFDSGYTIGLKNEKSWLLFTTPYIKATISGLPVIIYFTPSSKSSWSTITFLFSPLMKENSKRVYSTLVSFTMYLEKSLKKDVKPDVLSCVEKARKDGLTSGVNRAISTVRREAYAD